MYTHTHILTQAAFSQVEFIQANLAYATSAERAFADDQPFDVVYNLAAETKYGQSDEVSGWGCSGWGCSGWGYSGWGCRLAFLSSVACLCQEQSLHNQG